MPGSVTPAVTPGSPPVTPGSGYNSGSMARAVKGKRATTADGSFTVSGKASNGEGSLYREKDGTWRATYRVPGVARPRRVRGRTREEARGTRRQPPKRITGTPDAPFDVTYSAASAYAFKRPIRSTPAASSTVSNGASGNTPSTGTLMPHYPLSTRPDRDRLDGTHLD